MPELSEFMISSPQTTVHADAGEISKPHLSSDSPALSRTVRSPEMARMLYEELTMAGEHTGAAQNMDASGA
ncbi:MAG: hypothetical protein NTU78_04840 [Alphaproteobacteria bacterium]|nr:hypothetical protein [Alphaproteobacteria bacterium]